MQIRPTNRRQFNIWFKATYGNYYFPKETLDVIYNSWRASQMAMATTIIAYLRNIKLRNRHG